jgi:hypothetical protein
MYDDLRCLRTGSRHVGLTHRLGMYIHVSGYRKVHVHTVLSY